MADKRIAMQYDLKQNNVKASKMFGKWYAQPVVVNTLNLKGFAQHIASHNGTYKASTIKGVMEEMVECLTEMVSQGVGVKLDGLGTFYPRFEGSGAETPEEFDVDSYVKGIHIRFLPENTKDEELTSRKFKTKCVLKRRFPLPTTTTEEGE
jgi:predicted histone-like DNA-binding protein